MYIYFLIRPGVKPMILLNSRTPFASRWIVPLLLIVLLGGFFSMRLLSDPDLGFHLKYGQWIIKHQTIPEKDQSTYTVPNNEYIDIHWLFQVALYGVYVISGYRGISIMVCLASVCLLLSLLWRFKILQTGPGVALTGLLVSILIIEPSFGPHPELPTFIFMTISLVVMDLYFHRKKNILLLLPVIQLIWCNMHGLFILGIIIDGAYFISLWIRNRKIDRIFLLWYALSIIICLFNPYFIKGFLFPLELTTRFNPSNIYNQHIQEFIPFFNQPHFALRDYLFLILLISSFLLMMLTYRKRPVHELLLVLLFSLLALVSIRNIPLFVLVAMPVCANAATGLKFRPGIRLERCLTILLTVIPLLLIPRVATDAWYLKNNSFNKTGMGLDEARQPVRAVKFLLQNHLEGRILNSIGYGGWLSWELKQPVFIDGRLEVMQEGIYREITDSWYDGLPRLISVYHPDIIIYNYLTYYPWTLQLARMADWRLIYLDGAAAIYARSGYADPIPALDISALPPEEAPISGGRVFFWLRGFYQPVDYQMIELQHKTHFRLQVGSVIKNSGNSEAIRFYNSGNEKYRQGYIQGAMADFTRAIELKPDYAKAYNNRAILFATELKEFAAAFADFNRALEIDPGYSDAWLGRGTAFFLQNKRDSACENWRRAALMGNPRAERLIGSYCNPK